MVERISRYVFCGWYQFRLGQRLKGLVLFFAFASSAFLGARYLLGAQSPQEIAIGVVSLVLAGLIWGYHVVDIAEWTRQKSVAADDSTEEFEISPKPSKSRVSGGKKASIVSDELYTKGRVAYLRGSYPEAKDCFEQLLRSDRADSDAAFQLGRVHRQLGDSRQAEKYFRQCRELPGGGKWSEEIKKYLQENRS